MDANCAARRLLCRRCRGCGRCPAPLLSPVSLILPALLFLCPPLQISPTAVHNKLLVYFSQAQTAMLLLILLAIGDRRGCNRSRGPIHHAIGATGRGRMGPLILT